MPRHDYQDDDGRTIANMDIEGMRWRRKPPAPPADTGAREPLSKRDQARAAMSATLAGLCVAFGMIAVFALFILFCTHVWFR